MIPQLVVTGTDTNVGKTILSSLLMASLPDYHYWKPIQSGLQSETDSETVSLFSGCGSERILDEAYRLTQPLSPHLSAKLDGTKIELEHLDLPVSPKLIIEGAGGVLVPVTEQSLMIDLFARWDLPLLIATRSALGTINHTLLTIEALRKRNIPILGCVTIGDLNIKNEEAITKYGGIEVLGRIPPLSSLNSTALRMVFEHEFDMLRLLLTNELAKS
jgi:dethiobiotin synthetase